MRFLMFLLFGLVSCVTSSPSSFDPTTLQQNVVIFVPDYLGSELVSKEGHELRWYPWYRSVWGGGSITYVEPEEESIVTDDRLIPAGLQESLPVFLGWRRDLNGSFVGALEQELQGKASLLPFTYDWREPMALTVQKLGDWVDALKRHRIGKVSLVCQGTGGLICAYYYRYGVQNPQSAQQNWAGSQKLHGMVTIGTPFLGSIAAWEQINDGIRVGINGGILSREQLGSFPSAYQLLPSPRSDFIVNERRQNMSRTLYGPQNWLQNGWGYLAKANRLNPEIRRSRYNFLKKALEQAYAFSEKLNAAPGPTARVSGRILNVYSRVAPTPARLLWHTEKKRFIDDAAAIASGEERKVWESMLEEEGDQTIPVVSAKLPKAFQVAFEGKEMEVNEDHDSLLKAEGLTQAIAAFVL